MCTVARKPWYKLGLDVLLVRDAPINAVVDVLGKDAPDVERYLQLRGVGEHLLELAGEELIGPGMARLMMAAVAVYAANRVTDGKALTQAEVVAAGTEILDTTRSWVSRYSPAPYDAYMDRYGTDDPAAVLERGRVQLH